MLPPIAATFSDAAAEEFDAASVETTLIMAPEFLNLAEASSYKDFAPQFSAKGLICPDSYARIEVAARNAFEAAGISRGPDPRRKGSETWLDAAGKPITVKRTIEDMCLPAGSGDYADWFGLRAFSRADAQPRCYDDAGNALEPRDLETNGYLLALDVRCAVPSNWPGLSIYINRVYRLDRITPLRSPGRGAGPGNVAQKAAMRLAQQDTSSVLDRLRAKARNAAAEVAE